MVNRRGVGPLEKALQPDAVLTTPRKPQEGLAALAVTPRVMLLAPKLPELSTGDHAAQHVRRLAISVHALAGPPVSSG